MREIKFRAWDKIKKCWVYFTLAETMLTDWEVKHPNADKYLQFTGLLDSKGKEIYEGDVVTNEFYKNGKPMNPTVVEWIESGFAPFGYDTFGDEGWAGNKTTVIGNVYENPELLK